MNLIHKLEPVFWMLFGAGAMAAAFVLPALFLAVLVLAPLGLLGGLSFQHAHALASSVIGKGLMALVLPLTFWHCAHHMRHLALDLGGHSLAPFAAYGSYGLALAATIASFVVIGAL